LSEEVIDFGIGLETLVVWMGNGLYDEAMNLEKSGFGA
jgi:hypothetical protein